MFFLVAFFNLYVCSTRLRRKMTVTSSRRVRLTLLPSPVVVWVEQGVWFPPESARNVATSTHVWLRSVSGAKVTFKAEHAQGRKMKMYTNLLWLS